MLGIKRITGAAGPAPDGEPGSWVSDAAREMFHGGLPAGLRAVAAARHGVRCRDGDRDHPRTRLPAALGRVPGRCCSLVPGATQRPWAVHAAALAGDGPVYGIDMPRVRESQRPARALLTPPASCAAWLDELLGKLSDRPAHLVGFSYGGWVV